MTRAELLDYLTEIEGKLGDVVSDLQMFADMIEQDVTPGELPMDAGGTTARMEAYIIPALQAWISEKRQTGSIADIRDELTGPTLDEEAAEESSVQKSERKPPRMDITVALACKQLTERIVEIGGESGAEWDATVEFLSSDRGATTLEEADITHEQYIEWVEWHAELVEAGQYGL